MSSKKFRNQVCVYCGTRLATTSDHLFAREFFVPSARQNLPQVPACSKCNNSKSKLEHYLTTLLPFGGRHADANEALTELVPRRLAKNVRLAQHLRAGQGHIWHMENQVIRPAMVVPIDPIRTTALFSLIAQGLAWLHFGITVQQPNFISDAIFLTKSGEDVFARLLSLNAANRVHHDLGHGTISYQGTQAVSVPEFTIWRIKFYGGLVVSDDPRQPGEIAKSIGAITGPRVFVYTLLGE